MLSGQEGNLLISGCDNERLFINKGVCVTEQMALRQFTFYLLYGRCFLSVW